MKKKTTKFTFDRCSIVSNYALFRIYVRGLYPSAKFAVVISCIMSETRISDSAYFKKFQPKLEKLVKRMCMVMKLDSDQVIDLIMEWDYIVIPFDTIEAAGAFSDEFDGDFFDVTLLEDLQPVKRKRQNSVIIDCPACGGDIDEDKHFCEDCGRDCGVDVAEAAIDHVEGMLDR